MVFWSPTLPSLVRHLPRGTLGLPVVGIPGLDRLDAGGRGEVHLERGEEGHLLEIDVDESLIGVTRKDFVQVFLHALDRGPQPAFPLLLSHGQKELGRRGLIG